MSGELGFSIRIVDEDGDPYYDLEVLVRIWITSQTTGVASSHTDSDGWASFVLETERETMDIKTISVWKGLFNKLIEIDTEGDIQVSDGDTMSFVVSREE